MISTATGLVGYTYLGYAGFIYLFIYICFHLFIV
jgi:hypothetical protein